ncbi:uncharacterized protein EI97DRAFT_434936 [Westerdykella ornata]|uniref:BZIP domain-containing protein n=1 Tax=Westerdykella ornata TaxID=318751 RepID=A0A6A6JEI8_WESOR|nr:uncharacterized protein EI97DRAFT_434936 [Westerdykella ornata]KAF2274707.1 hypothetical protein EI97DRAFT_434936 [Westerdykella ornata]
MPADRRTKTATPEEVPRLGDPDRKRVLNVLAQRRYRQRRKEKLAELEARARTSSLTDISPQPSGGGIQLGPECLSSSSSDQGRSSSSPSDYATESSHENDVEEIVPGVSLPSTSFEDVNFNPDPIDLGLFTDFGFETLDQPNGTAPESLMQPISYSQPATFSFPLAADGAQLDIPLLPALRAFSLIISALDIGANIWNPFYLHVLPPTPNPSLPPNLHPTPAQITIPHHPMLDTLPWPTVREKLICMLALPSPCRPPVAQEAEGEGQGTAIVRIMQDLDDFRDGIRNHGNTSTWGNGNELVEEAWEIGEVFYRHWWWCLDQKIIERSNQKRRERGLGRLQIKA